MGSTPTDRVVVVTESTLKDEDVSTPFAAPKPKVPEEMDLDIHKQRLAEAARAVDFLQPLRDHPFVTVGTAAALGVIASAVPGAGRVAQSAATSSSLFHKVLRMGSMELVQAFMRGREAATTTTTEPKGDPAT